ncbi:hypothetical protein BK634_07870 [Pseudomonas chlororaphis]|nr:hypothetical protein BK634_07870 [Pseudomonas chlororaphis]
MRPSGFASTSRPLSLASQLLHKVGFVGMAPVHTSHRRSRLAGDEALGFCIGLKAAIAGKPAPTRVGFVGMASVLTIHRRSRLAGDEALGFCIDLKAAIAGKPAPT